MLQGRKREDDGKLTYPARISSKLHFNLILHLGLGGFILATSVCQYYVRIAAAGSNGTIQAQCKLGHCYNF